MSNIGPFPPETWDSVLKEAALLQVENGSIAGRTIVNIACTSHDMASIALPVLYKYLPFRIDPAQNKVASYQSKRKRYFEYVLYSMFGATKYPYFCFVETLHLEAIGEIMFEHKVHPGNKGILLGPVKKYLRDNGRPACLSSIGMLRCNTDVEWRALVEELARTNELKTFRILAREAAIEITYLAIESMSKVMMKVAKQGTRVCLTEVVATGIYRLKSGRLLSYVCFDQLRAISLSYVCAKMGKSLAKCPRLKVSVHHCSVLWVPRTR